MHTVIILKAVMAACLTANRGVSGGGILSSNPMLSCINLIAVGHDIFSMVIVPLLFEEGQQKYVHLVVVKHLGALLLCLPQEQWELVN